MSYTFTKLFSSLPESTIWVEPYATRIVWITMLATADREGRVFGSIPGLAKRAAVTLEECEAALLRFQQPDRYSRTPDHDGRRIEPIDGGWALLNYLRYREMRDDEARREQNRAASAKYRESLKASAAVINPADNQPPSANPSAHAEEEAEAEDASSQEGRGEQRTAARSRPAASKVTWSAAGFETPADILGAMGVAYPGVNLLHEIGKAHVWVLSNPAKRKSDWGRFLNSWMSRAHGDLKRQAVPAAGAGAASHSVQRAQQVREEAKAAAAAMAPMPESIRGLLPRRPAGDAP